MVDLPAPEEPSSTTVRPRTTSAIGATDSWADSAAALLVMRSYFGKARRPFRAHVHLVQCHHRLRAACGGQYQVAFETPEVVVTVEAHHDDDQVDIRRQNLFPAAAGRWREMQVVRGSTLSISARVASARRA